MFSEYGFNVLTTITTLSFECCDIACTSEVIKRDFCCHEESCRRRCSTKNDIKIREAPFPEPESSDDSASSESSNLKEESSDDSSRTFKHSEHEIRRIEGFKYSPKGTVDSEHSNQKPRSKAAEFRFRRVHHRHH